MGSCVKKKWTISKSQKYPRSLTGWYNQKLWIGLYTINLEDVVWLPLRQLFTRDQMTQKLHKGHCTNFNNVYSLTRLCVSMDYVALKTAGTLIFYWFPKSIKYRVSNVQSGIDKNFLDFYAYLNIGLLESIQIENGPKNVH